MEEPIHHTFLVSNEEKNVPFFRRKNLQMSFVIRGIEQQILVAFQRSCK